jgi:hypothetical protein
VGNQSGLNLLDSLPVNLGICKLRRELIKVSQALPPIEQIRIGDRVRCTREEIRQSHLVAHANRQHIQREIKRTGNLLEDIAQELMCNRVSTQ